VKFTEEHQQLRETVEKFVESELNPYVEQWEREGIYPAHEVMKKLGDLGLLGITRSAECGGLELDLSYTIVMAEALGKCHCSGIPMSIGVQTDMCTPALANFGSDYLKENFLKPSIAGDMVGSIGVSESGGGSDVAAVKTTAVKDGDDYVINGEKMWITNGMQADWICLLANTSEGKPHQNKSLIIVPMDAKGVERSRKLDKMGMRASDTAQLFFDNVRVPRRHLIGEVEGLGFMQQMSQFQDERIWGAANLASGLEEALDMTKEYTKERKTFGQSILDNQFVHFKLAELSTEIEALKSLTYRAAALHIERNDPFDMDVVRLASMAKYKAGRLGREVLDWCVQFHGGMGYMFETRINRLYRDVRLVAIGGGADEIMLGIICKLEGTLPRKKSSLT
jgi:citronellyl-CoA dehydrogenase